ncbi:MAG: GxxExxY protein [Candidatus Doudnabacteria bacterium]|jgi:GxxExxY protein
MPVESTYDLSHEVIGVLYAVYNELGFGYQEKYYYRGIKIKLMEKKLKVTEQLAHTLKISDKPIGRYFLDFLIENEKDKLILELKVAEKVYPQHIRQVLAYLKAHNLKYGLIGVYSPHGVIIKRVAN